MRWVLDFRRVNDLSVTDSFPTPNISEILGSLGKSKYFSTLDASQAYHLIEVEKEFRPITAFATTFGLYQFVRMPFGLKNSSASDCRFVQRLVDILGVPGIVAYLDDVLVHSADLETHVHLIRLVFQAHKEAGIRLNANKTHLFQEEVEYLGHLVDAEGVKLIPSYVQKITEWPLPQTGKELSAFLGFTNYYRDFLPGFANVTAELNSVKNNKLIVWTPEMIITLTFLNRCLQLRRAEPHQIFLQPLILTF